jgi:hypothetical protein
MHADRPGHSRPPGQWRRRLVFNADNCTVRRSDRDGQLSGGAPLFSVPAGHYWAVGQFLRFGDGSFRLRLAVLPQFTVSGTTTVVSGPRAARSRSPRRGPRSANKPPSASQGRPGGLGDQHQLDCINTKFWVSPTTTKPGVGSLQSFTSADVTSWFGRPAVRVQP